MSEWTNVVFSFCSICYLLSPECFRSLFWFVCTCVMNYKLIYMLWVLFAFHMYIQEECIINFRCGRKQIFHWATTVWVILYMWDRKYFRSDVMTKCKNVKTSFKNRMNVYGLYGDIVCIECPKTKRFHNDFINYFLEV